MTARNVRRRRAGFTLMEVLLVLAILVIIGSIVVVNFTGIMGGADEDSSQIQVDNVANACKLFKTQMGRAPTDLTELVNKPAQIPRGRNWRGPYMDEIPNDQWDRALQYTSNTQTNTFEVRSAGTDGQFNTEDDLIGKG